MGFNSALTQGLVSNNCLTIYDGEVIESTNQCPYPLKAYLRFTRKKYLSQRGEKCRSHSFTFVNLVYGQPLRGDTQTPNYIIYVYREQKVN